MNRAILCKGLCCVASPVKSSKFIRYRYRLGVYVYAIDALLYPLSASSLTYWMHAIFFSFAL